MAYESEEIDLDEVEAQDEEVVETRSASKPVSVSRTARRRIEEYFEEKYLKQLINYDM